MGNSKMYNMFLVSLSLSRGPVAYMYVHCDVVDDSENVEIAIANGKTDY